MNILTYFGIVNIISMWIFFITDSQIVLICLGIIHTIFVLMGVMSDY